MQSILGRIMDFYFARGRGRIITRALDDGTTVPYLARAILFRCRWFGVFLHCFITSDTGGVHDHPWDNATFVLTTGYWEEMADGKRWFRPPGCFRFRKAENFHRVHLLPEAEMQTMTWTLFFVGRRRRLWGFLPEENGWRPSSDAYINAEDEWA